MEPLLGQPQFFKSTKLWEQVVEKITSTFALLNEREKNSLKSNFEKLDSLLNSLVKVERRMSNNTILYYTLAHDVNFTDYSEFLEIFKGQNLMLASHTADNYTHLQKDELDIDKEVDKRKA